MLVGNLESCRSLQAAVPKLLWVFSLQHLPTSGAAGTGPKNAGYDGGMPTKSKEPAVVLTLARTFKYFGFGNVDDYVVLDGDRVVGRIFKPPQALSYRPWFWTITAIDKTPSVDNRGYAATREDAMADFKKRWSATR